MTVGRCRLIQLVTVTNNSYHIILNLLFAIFRSCNPNCHPSLLLWINWYDCDAGTSCVRQVWQGWCLCCNHHHYYSEEGHPIISTFLILVLNVLTVIIMIIEGNTVEAAQSIKDRRSLSASPLLSCHQSLSSENNYRRRRSNWRQNPSTGEGRRQSLPPKGWWRKEQERSVCLRKEMICIWWWKHDY